MEPDGLQCDVSTSRKSQTVENCKTLYAQLQEQEAEVASTKREAQVAVAFERLDTLFTDLEKQVVTVHETVATIAEEIPLAQASLQGAGLNPDDAYTMIEERYVGRLDALKAPERRTVTPVLREAGLSQRAVAAICGVNKSQVSRDEKPTPAPKTAPVPPVPSCEPHHEDHLPDVVTPDPGTISVEAHADSGWQPVDDPEVPETGNTCELPEVGAGEDDPWESGAPIVGCAENGWKMLDEYLDVLIAQQWPLSANREKSINRKIKKIQNYMKGDKTCQTPSVR